MADWLGAGAEHPTAGGGGGLLLGADHPGGALSRFAYVCISDSAYDGAWTDTTDGLVVGAHWVHSTHHSKRDEASWRDVRLQISAADPVHIDRVSGFLAPMLR